MRMRELRKWDTDELYISPKQNNGDFDWYAVIRVTYLHEYDESFEHKYNVAVLVVSPSQAKETAALDSAIQFQGMGDDLDKNPYYQSDDFYVECLVDAGTYAQVWDKSGNNRDKLLRLARKEMRMLDIFFGFAMDKAQNRVGTTGWDSVRGELWFRTPQESWRA